MSLQEQIEKSFSARARGELSDYDLAIAHQRRAEELNKSLDEYYASPEGARALQDALRASFYEKQMAGALGNGHPIANKLGGGRVSGNPANPASQQSAFETPDAPRASDAPTINEGHIPMPVFNRAVELLAAAKNCTKDEAISMVYRAMEKRKKEQYTSPKVRAAKPDERDDDDDTDTSAADKVARLMKSHPDMRADEAHSAVHRAERMRKFGF